MSFLKTFETIFRGKELAPLPNKPIFGYNHKPQPLKFTQPVSFEEVTKEIEASSDEPEEEEKKTDESPKLIDKLDRNYWLSHLRTAHERGIAPRDAVMIPSEYYGDAEIMLEFIRLEPQGIMVATKSLVNSCDFLRSAYQIEHAIIAMLVQREDVEKEAMDFLMKEEEIDFVARSVKVFPDIHPALSH